MQEISITYPIENCLTIEWKSMRYGGFVYGLAGMHRKWDAWLTQPRF